MNRLTICIAAFLLSCPFVSLTAQPKLGLILPLSGKAAIPGETSRNAAIMANEALGRPFELVFEDNSLDSTRTIAAARKLISLDGVRGLIVYAAGPSTASAPIAEKAEIPMIGLAVDPKILASGEEARTAILAADMANRSLARKGVSANTCYLLSINLRRN